MLIHLLLHSGSVTSSPCFLWDRESLVFNKIAFCSSQCISVLKIWSLAQLIRQDTYLKPSWLSLPPIFSCGCHFLSWGVLSNISNFLVFSVICNNLQLAFCRMIEICVPTTNVPSVLMLLPNIFDPDNYFLKLVDTRFAFFRIF